MITDSKRFSNTIQAFDKANAQDPFTMMIDGKPYPKEVIYSKRMSEWLLKSYPNASEALQLATRCQHIGRWLLPRSEYPQGRVGYIKWRNALKEIHASKAEEIMDSFGYEKEIIDRVKFLVRKKNLKKDQETQALEDVICLVFLEFYFDDFASKHDEPKIIDIVKKTWVKMSAEGQELVSTIEFSDSSATLLKKALA